MSKVKARQRVEQLKEWMASRGIKPKAKPAQPHPNFSRNEYYKSKGA